MSCFFFDCDSFFKTLIQGKIVALDEEDGFQRIVNFALLAPDIKMAVVPDSSGLTKFRDMDR